MDIRVRCTVRNFLSHLHSPFRSLPAGARDEQLPVSRTEGSPQLSLTCLTIELNQNLIWPDICHKWKVWYRFITRWNLNKWKVFLFFRKYSRSTTFTIWTLSASNVLFRLRPWEISSSVKSLWTAAARPPAPTHSSEPEAQGAAGTRLARIGAAHCPRLES
jgi:hypothetical protein